MIYSLKVAILFNFQFLLILVCLISLIFFKDGIEIDCLLAVNSPFVLLAKSIYKKAELKIKTKKHVAIDHCHSFSKDHNKFRKKWVGKSGIYKITCLLNNKFYYYGSSTKYI